jgi:hypothetical protein
VERHQKSQLQSCGRREGQNHQTTPSPSRIDDASAVHGVDGRDHGLLACMRATTTRSGSCICTAGARDDAPVLATSCNIHEIRMPLRHGIDIRLQ